MKESGVGVAPRSSRSAPEKKEEPLSVSESSLGEGRRRAREPSEWHTQFVQLIDIHQRERDLSDSFSPWERAIRAYVFLDRSTQSTDPLDYVLMCVACNMPVDK